MIISASRRTDIPAFYSEWFINRVKEGFFLVRNPINKHQVSRIKLTPDVVDCIVFWTKNPIPMMKYIDELNGYDFYFQFTLTGYGRDIEANLPDKKTELIPAFKELSEKIGKERVIWRYDPILFNETYTPDYHLHAFAQIANELSGYTEHCVISFVDIYRKNKKNMGSVNVQEKPDDWLIGFAGGLQKIAEECGMKVGSCAETIDLSSVGIEHNSCIDKKLIEKITGGTLNIKKDPTQRQECGCVSSIEAGAYNTCGNGCRYCYANFSPDAVKENMKEYDPDSQILCDKIMPDDKITDRPVKSLLDRQISLF